MLVNFNEFYCQTIRVYSIPTSNRYLSMAGIVCGIMIYFQFIHYSRHLPRTHKPLKIFPYYEMIEHVFNIK